MPGEQPGRGRDQPAENCGAQPSTETDDDRKSLQARRTSVQPSPEALLHTATIAVCAGDRRTGCPAGALHHPTSGTPGGDSRRLIRSTRPASAAVMEPTGRPAARRRALLASMPWARVGLLPLVEHRESALLGHRPIKTPVDTIWRAPPWRPPGTAIGVAEAMLNEGLPPLGATGLMLAVRETDETVRLVGSYGISRLPVGEGLHPLHRDEHLVTTDLELGQPRCGRVAVRGRPRSLTLVALTGRPEHLGEKRVEASQSGRMCPVAVPLAGDGPPARGFGQRPAGRRRP